MKRKAVLILCLTAVLAGALIGEFFLFDHLERNARSNTLATITKKDNAYGQARLRTLNDGTVEVAYDYSPSAITVSGYLRVCDYRLSPVQLLRIVENGNGTWVGYKPLAPKVCGGLDGRAQQKVYAGFSEYDNDQGSDLGFMYGKYIDDLNAFYTKYRKEFPNNYPFTTELGANGVIGLSTQNQQDVVALFNKVYPTKNTQ